jgi:hypothetical protein
MSPPKSARKQKRLPPPTPHAPAGCGPATKAETLALELAIQLAGIARNHLAPKPVRKRRQDDAEFHDAVATFWVRNSLTIANALHDEFKHLEQPVVQAMLDVPELLRAPLLGRGFVKVHAAIAAAERALRLELKKVEVSRLAARTTLKGRGDLFAMDGGAR